MAEEAMKNKSEDLPSTPITPLDRPVRERKLTKAFDPSIVRDSPREFIIEQGKGSQLKEIPNVANKLSKLIRGDEMLETLHILFYGRRGKAYHFKRDILQFSGFVWGEDEENKLKGKLKLKDKLDKMKRDDLWRICDVMDVRVSKSGKKEEMLTKLIQFLQAPCEVEKKRKKMEKVEERTPGKRRKKNGGHSEEIEGAEEEEDDGKEGENEVEAAKKHLRIIKQKKEVAKSPGKRIKKNVSRDKEEEEEEEGIVKDEVEEAKKQWRMIKRENVEVKTPGKTKKKNVSFYKMERGKEEEEGIEDEIEKKEGEEDEEEERIEDQVEENETREEEKEKEIASIALISHSRMESEEVKTREDETKHSKSSTIKEGFQERESERVEEEEMKHSKSSNVKEGFQGRESERVKEEEDDHLKISTIEGFQKKGSCSHSRMEGEEVKEEEEEEDQNHSKSLITKEGFQKRESEENYLESNNMDDVPWCPPTKEIILKLTCDILKEEEEKTKDEGTESKKTESEYPSDLEIKLTICKVLEDADFENGRLRDVLIEVCKHFNMEYDRNKDKYLGPFLFEILHNVVAKQEEEEEEDDASVECVEDDEKGVPEEYDEEKNQENSKKEDDVETQQENSKEEDESDN